MITGDSGPVAQPIDHPLVVVLNSECDLEWDYKVRYPEAEEGEEVEVPEAKEIDKHLKSVPYLFLLDLFEDSKENRRLNSLNSETLRRAKQNQDERRHTLRAGSVQESEEELPLLFADFKKTFALPTQFVYDRLAEGEVERVGVIPPIFVHALSQRFYAYHSRVGVPDDET